MADNVNLHETNELIKRQNASDHLANERTMLAWVRTGIGIIAFGFAVVKFSLFVRQISLVISIKPIAAPRGYSSVIGITLVGVGALTILLSYLKYKKTEQQLTNGTYTPSSFLIRLLTGLIFIISIALFVYLIQSV